MTTLLVLLVGLGLGAYFVVVRGAGLQAELQSPQAIELEILGGALLLLAGTGYFAVWSAMRSARAGGGGRELLQRALELDYGDPDALAEFDDVPELRELVGMLMADKTQVRELADRVETLRGEIDGLAAGMQRSARDLARMREESLSEIGVQVARLWNGLVERVVRAEERASRTSDAAAAADAPANQPDLGDLIQRLDSLESELQRLRAVRGSAQTTSGVATPGMELLETADELTPASVRADVPTWSGRPAAFTDPTAPVVTPARPVEVEDADSEFESERVYELDDPVETAAEFESSPAFRLDTGAGLEDSATGAAAVPPVDEEPTEMGFPHFVGRPVKSVPDRVEVMYEAQDGEEVEDLPPSAFLFASEDPGAEPDQVVDLRSLGALEFQK